MSRLEKHEHFEESYDHLWDYPGPHRDVYDNPPATGWLKDSVAEWFNEMLPNWREHGVGGDGCAIVIELGSWLGKTMRHCLDEHDDNFWIAIDTWQDSPNHQAEPRYAELMPHLYEAFLHINMAHRDSCTPLRCKSLRGLHICHEFDLEPDCIFIDAEHTREAVHDEIMIAKQFFPNAIIIGDDTQVEGVERGARDAAGKLTKCVDFVTVAGAFIIA